MSPMTAATELTTPMTLTSNNFATASALRFVAWAVMPTPAFANNTSIGPNLVRSSSTARRTACSSVTSAGNGIAWPPAAPISSTISCNASARRASNPTAAPRRASSVAKPRPIPEDAPVTRTTLFRHVLRVSSFKFQVSSWTRFFEFGSLDSRSSKISHEAANHATNFGRIVHKQIESVLWQIFLIQRHIQLRSNLARRAFGRREELTKLAATTSFKAFGYVRHNQNRSSANLVSQAVVSAKAARGSNLVYFSGQFPRLLPRTYFLEPLESSQGTPRERKMIKPL